MKSRYHQKVAEQSKEKTSFSYGQEMWQFKVMSFGLCNVPVTFERLMEGAGGNPNEDSFDLHRQRDYIQSDV